MGAPLAENRLCAGDTPNFRGNTDQVLIRKSVRERWPVTAELRERVVSEITEILEDHRIDASLRLTAARTAVSIDALNLKEQEIKVRAQPKHIVHTNMSTEELLERIKTLQEETGIMFAGPAAQALLEAEDE